MHKLAVLCLVFLSGPMLAAEGRSPCTDASSTIAVNRCLSEELDRAEVVLARYLDASRVSLAHDRETLLALDAAQSAWETYRSQHCDAVYSR